MKATIDMPPLLNKKYAATIEKCNKLFYSHKYKEAVLAFKEAYNLLLTNQPSNIRYHKGAELFGIASAYVRQRKPNTALKYYIKAYIEDVLSYDSKSANSTPAAQVLKNVYRLEDKVFKEIANTAKMLIKRQSIIKDPQEVIESSKLLRKIMLTETRNKTLPQKRIVGQFKSHWENRVFVGGNYKDQIAILNEIKTSVEKHGYDPVLAEDFDIPQEEIHHHSLMLLHECKKAIFEISSEAGQLLEIERVRDYGIDEPLLLYQSSNKDGVPKVTAMVSTLCSRYKWQPRPYATTSRLKKLIKEYLITEK